MTLVPTVPREGTKEFSNILGFFHPSNIKFEFDHLI
jgi:hypothetical protein